MSFNMIGFLHTVPGQIIAIAYSILFIVFTTLAILTKHENPHKSSFFTIISLTLGFFLLLFSLSVVLQLFPEGIASSFGLLSSI